MSWFPIFSVYGCSGRAATSCRRMGLGEAGSLWVGAAQAKRALALNGWRAKFVQVGQSASRLLGQP